MDDKTIRRLISLPLGDRTNHVLDMMLSPFFLGYWTFSRPKFKGIEFADTLLVWDDVCLLFEAKTRSVPGGAPRVWIKTQIQNAASTLNKRAKMLSSGQVTDIRNKYRGVLEWKKLNVSWYYGVIILQHQSESYDAREIAEDAFRKSQIPIQVFSLYDFLQLIRVIN